MTLYSPQSTPRLRYMANWLGHYLFGKPLQLSNDAAKPGDGEPLINYSAEQLPVTSFQIIPGNLLFQTTIRPLNVGVLQKNGLPRLMDDSGRQMDLLSAAFFLISRYEEYLPHNKDEYGRYAHTNSVTFRYGLLKRPLVDEWVAELKQQLLVVFPSLVFNENKFRFIPTYDVDIAWSYKNKGWLRTGGGFFKDIIKSNWKNFAERMEAISGQKQDPFDVFEELDLLHEKYALEPHYFVLMGQKTKGYDKNISPYNQAYRSLIRSICSRYDTGIHLSWQSFASNNIKQQEINLLADIMAVRPVENRMHYINFHLPDTFQTLLTLGITREYSMGYGSINGFRAATCRPYYWYDLSNEQETKLEIFPFCYMEANSIFEQKDNTEVALQELQYYHDITRQYGGTLITIFHNHLIGLSKQGRAWMLMYKTFLENNFS